MKEPSLRTLKELKQSGYQVLPVKEEIRKNLIDKLKGNEKIFLEIIGYDDTVIPYLQNALLAKHDIIFLGERGQAKTKLIRSLASLLDPCVPKIKDCEINDNPFSPLCVFCREKAGMMGDDLEIEWISPDERYGEKLATPDVTIGDLIGEVDPVRVAEGRYLSDLKTLHYGLIPRTNRGIFSINELPDLSEKVQVGLFNIMEEKDVQIKGYKVRLPLDLLMLASANPDDYTSRGKIITPLKDRFQAQIRTHYPYALADEIQIMEQESRFAQKDGCQVFCPEFMKEVVAELSFHLRRSPDINQRSGVSVRISISNYETLLACAEKRAILLSEKEAAPRISDLPAIIPNSIGKCEFEFTGNEENEEKIVGGLVRRAVARVFSGYYSVTELQDVVSSFENGGIKMEVGDDVRSSEYMKWVEVLTSLPMVLSRLNPGESPSVFASVLEFVLEGLHLNNLLSKETLQGKMVYRR